MFHHTSLAGNWPVTREALYKGGMCEYKNVCLQHGKLKYFAFDSNIPSAPNFSSLLDLSRLVMISQDRMFFDPNNLPPTTSPKVLRNIPNALTPFIVENGPITSDCRFGSADLYFYESIPLFQFNFAHVLMDSILPVLLAMEIIGFDWDEKQVVLLQGRRPDHARWGTRNLDLYRLLLKSTPIKYYDNPQELICAHRLVTGHDMLLNGMSRFYPDRGAHMRRIRAFVWSRLHLQTRAPQKGHYLVALKTGKLAGRQPTWPTLCEDVRSALSRIHENASVFHLKCTHPHTISFRENIDNVMKHTVFISEHGTVSYDVLFAQDFTCSILAGSIEGDQWITKDHIMMSYLTFVQVHFIPNGHKLELLNSLKHCSMMSIKNRFGASLQSRRGFNVVAPDPNVNFLTAIW